MIAGGFFSPEDPGLFAPIVHSLLDGGDYFMVLADFADYVRAQNEASRVFADPHKWARRSIMNTAGMAKFSSDRAVMEYAREIWGVKPLP